MNKDHLNEMAEAELREIANHLFGGPRYRIWAKGYFSVSVAFAEGVVHPGDVLLYEPVQLDRYATKVWTPFIKRLTIVVPLTHIQAIDPDLIDEDLIQE